MKTWIYAASEVKGLSKPTESPHLYRVMQNSKIPMIYEVLGDADVLFPWLMETSAV